MMDIRLTQNNRQEITIYDNTQVGINQLPDEINTLTLQVITSRGDDSGVIDIINYLYTNREDSELYILRPENFGLGTNDYLPDAVYTFRYNVNNQFIQDIKIVIALEIMDAIDKLLLDSEYKINIDTNEVRYATDKAKGNIELIRIVIALYEELQLAALENDYIKATRILDKLQRLLKLKRQ